MKYLLLIAFAFLTLLAVTNGASVARDENCAAGFGFTYSGYCYYQAVEKATKSGADDACSATDGGELAHIATEDHYNAARDWAYTLFENHDEHQSRPYAAFWLSQQYDYGVSGIYMSSKQLFVYVSVSFLPRFTIFNILNGKNIKKYLY